MTAGPDCLIEPGNPYDFSPDELDELRRELASEGVSVAIARRPERGYGVTFVEVLHVWDLATDVVGDVTTIVGPVAVVLRRWLRRRAQRKREQHPDAKPRPTVVNLFGPDGRVLKKIVVDDADSDPRFEDGDDEHRQRPPLSE